MLCLLLFVLLFEDFLSPPPIQRRFGARCAVAGEQNEGRKNFCYIKCHARCAVAGGSFTLTKCANRLRKYFFSKVKSRAIKKPLKNSSVGTKDKKFVCWNKFYYIKNTTPSKFEAVKRSML